MRQPFALYTTFILFPSFFFVPLFNVFSFFLSSSVFFSPSLSPSFQCFLDFPFPFFLPLYFFPSPLSLSYGRPPPSPAEKYVLFHYGKLSGLLALAATMAVVLSGFLAYHCYLTVKGTTTNESAKWSEVKGKRLSFRPE